MSDIDISNLSKTELKHLLRTMGMSLDRQKHSKDYYAQLYSTANKAKNKVTRDNTSFAFDDSQMTRRKRRRNAKINHKESISLIQPIEENEEEEDIDDSDNKSHEKMEKRPLVNYFRWGIGTHKISINEEEDDLKGKWGNKIIERDGYNPYSGKGNDNDYHQHQDFHQQQQNSDHRISLNYLPFQITKIATSTNPTSVIEDKTEQEGSLTPKIITSTLHFNDKKSKKEGMKIKFKSQNEIALPQENIIKDEDINYGNNNTIDQLKQIKLNSTKFSFKRPYSPEQTMSNDYLKENHITKIQYPISNSNEMDNSVNVKDEGDIKDHSYHHKPFETIKIKYEDDDVGSKERPINYNSHTTYQYQSSLRNDIYENQGDSSHDDYKDNINYNENRKGDNENNKAYSKISYSLKNYEDKEEPFMNQSNIIVKIEENPIQIIESTIKTLAKPNKFSTIDNNNIGNVDTKERSYVYKYKEPIQNPYSEKMKSFESPYTKTDFQDDYYKNKPGNLNKWYLNTMKIATPMKETIQYNQVNQYDKTDIVNDANDNKDYTHCDNSKANNYKTVQWKNIKPIANQSNERDEIEDYSNDNNYNKSIHDEEESQVSSHANRKIFVNPIIEATTDIIQDKPTKKRDFHMQSYTIKDKEDNYNNDKNANLNQVKQQYNRENTIIDESKVWFQDNQPNQIKDNEKEYDEGKISVDYQNYQENDEDKDNVDNSYFNKKLFLNQRRGKNIEKKLAINAKDFENPYVERKSEAARLNYYYDNSQNYIIEDNSRNIDNNIIYNEKKEEKVSVNEPIQITYSYRNNQKNDSGNMNSIANEEMYPKSNQYEVYNQVNPINMESNQNNEEDIDIDMKENKNIKMKDNQQEYDEEIKLKQNHNNNAINLRNNNKIVQINTSQLSETDRIINKDKNSNSNEIRNDVNYFNVKESVGDDLVYNNNEEEEEEEIKYPNDYPNDQYNIETKRRRNEIDEKRLNSSNKINSNNAMMNLNQNTIISQNQSQIHRSQAFPIQTHESQFHQTQMSKPQSINMQSQTSQTQYQISQQNEGSQPFSFNQRRECTYLEKNNDDDVEFNNNNNTNRSIFDKSNNLNTSIQNVAITHSSSFNDSYNQGKELLKKQKQKQSNISLIYDPLLIIGFILFAIFLLNLSNRLDFKHLSIVFAIGIVLICFHLYNLRQRNYNQIAYNDYRLIKEQIHRIRISNPSTNQGLLIDEFISDSCKRHNLTLIEYKALVLSKLRQLIVKDPFMMEKQITINDKSKTIWKEI